MCRTMTEIFVWWGEEKKNTLNYTFRNRKNTLVVDRTCNIIITRYCTLVTLIANRRFEKSNVAFQNYDYKTWARVGVSCLCVRIIVRIYVYICVCTLCKYTRSSVCIHVRLLCDPFNLGFGSRDAETRGPALLGVSHIMQKTSAGGLIIEKHWFSNIRVYFPRRNTVPNRSIFGVCVYTNRRL